VNRGFFTAFHLCSCSNHFEDGGKMDSLSINLKDGSFQANPYPIYQQLRENAPVFWFPFPGGTGGMWLVTRYNDVARMLKEEQRLTKNISRVLPAEQAGPPVRDLLRLDPPDHTRLRSLVNQVFTPRRIKEMEPRIRQIAAGLLDSARQRGEMDFMSDFAVPLPIIVIAELLGVPQEDWAAFRAWSNDLARSFDAVNQTEEIRKKGEESGRMLIGYLSDLVRQRREQPRADLITGLVQARDGGDRLSEEELLEMCQLILIAGHETTVNLLGNGMLALLQNPDQAERLRQQPELLESAVEEMLRYESPVQRGTIRFTLAPLEVAGQVIESGQQISAVIGSANRDPDQFPDPDRFDIARQPNRHLAFGRGIHFCLGAPLARTEARLAFDLLVHGFPALEMVDEKADWSSNTFLRGLNSLRVRW
jgi:cytochrome P450